MQQEDYGTKKKQVAYIYNQDIGKYYYGSDHPMKPKRVMMSHKLIVSLGLYRQVDSYKPSKASFQLMTKYHDPDYIRYLSSYVSPSIFKFMNPKSMLIQKYELDTKDTPSYLVSDINHNKQIFKVGETSDCPAFDGLFNFCQISAGGSQLAAKLIATESAQIAINWAGGLHHAKKREASGFCYVNDIVICILELLKYYQRVVYIDIDVHHGDGVQEAFFVTNRVMTVSFHEYGDSFFPGSGSIDSIGDGEGRYYSVNVPLRPGMNDDSFEPLFQRVMGKVMDIYRPGAVVLQSGADSLANDKLGHFNLSTKGHASCLKFMKKFGVPIILLGGGGYNVTNVSRCWAYETAVAAGIELETSTLIPNCDYFYERYLPDHQLHVFSKTMENQNSQDELNQLEERVLENLRHIQCVPGIQFHDLPNYQEFLYEESGEEDEMDAQSFMDGGIQDCLKQIDTGADGMNIEKLFKQHSPFSTDILQDCC